MTTFLTGTRTATSDGSVYKNVETDGYKLLDFNAKNFFGLVDAEGTTELADVEIGDGVIENIDRVFTHSAAPSIRNLFIHDLECTKLERGLGRVKVAHNTVVQRVRAYQQDVKTTAFSDAWATTDVETHGQLMEDVQFYGFRMEVPVGDYPNGGAFSDEEKSDGHVYRRCVAADGNDGWDVKSIDALLDRCRASSNRRNFRLWGPNTTAVDCVSTFVAADYTKSYVDSNGVTRTDLRPNAHWWFDSGRMTGATLIRPRFGDVAGSTVPYMKIEGGADVGAVIRVVDPMTLDGKLIPRDVFLSRVVQTDDGKTDVTVVVEYTPNITGHGPVADMEPHPPRVTQLGTVTPPPTDPTTPTPAPVQGPPTGVTATVNPDNTVTVRGSTPAGAATIEVYESVHADNQVPRTRINVTGLTSWAYTTGTPRTAGSSYKYTALAVASDGVTKSTRTSASPSTVTIPAAPAPVTPTTVLVTGTPGDGRATLAWQLQVGNDGANGVKVSRDGTDSLGAGPWTSQNYLATTGSLIFTRLVNDSTYVLTAQPTRDGVAVGTPASVTVVPKSAVAPPSEEPVDPVEPDTTELDAARERIGFLEAQVLQLETAYAASVEQQDEQAIRLDAYRARLVQVQDAALSLAVLADEQATPLG